MKKLLSMVLVLVMVLSMTTLVFAEENENFPKERLTQEERGEKPVQRGERVIHLFETYYPEMLEDILALQDEHQSFHDMTLAEREAMKASVKEEIANLREQLQNEEITFEEFKAIIETFKAEKEALKAEIEPIIEAKKAEAEGIRESIKSVFESIKASLDAGNEEIQPLLDQLYTLMASHVDMDYYYYDLVHEVIE
jgi:chromosome segregation ATPase